MYRAPSKCSLPARSTICTWSSSARSGWLDAFLAHCDYNLDNWLSDVFFDLAGAGRGDEALALHEAWTRLLVDGSEQLGSRALLLVHAGRPEQARAEAQRRMQEHPKDLDALSLAAQVEEACGDLEAAERLGRKHLELARQLGDTEEQLMAARQLADVLRARGQHEEAEALEAMIDEGCVAATKDELDEAAFDEAQRHMLAAAVKRKLLSRAPAQPAALPAVSVKLGRNQSCQCGRGKKYKKCCGA